MYRKIIVSTRYIF